MVHIYGIFDREITVYTVIYGAYIRYFWQGNHCIYGHIWCIYSVFLAGKSPNIRSYMVHIYGSGQPYVSATWSHRRVLQSRDLLCSES